MYVISDVQTPRAIPAAAAAKSKIATLETWGLTAMETSSTKAAAAPPHKTHSLGSKLGRAAQSATVPKPLTGHDGRYVRSAVHRPTPTPTGTDATPRAYAR